MTFAVSIYYYYTLRKKNSFYVSKNEKSCHNIFLQEVTEVHFYNS